MSDAATAATPPSEISSLRRMYADDVRRLSEIRPGRVAALIAWQWVVLAAAIALPILVLYASTGRTNLFAALSQLSFAGTAILVAAYVASIVVIAGRQHALAVIMHDAVHYRLLHDRMLAEIVSNWLCAFPVGMVTSLYRRSHLLHHFFTNKPNDPDWRVLTADENFSFPKERRAFYKLLLKDLIGGNLRAWWNTIRFWLGYPYVFRRNGGGFLSTAERLQYGLFWLMVLSAVTWLHAWPYFLLLWVLPSYTLTLLFTRIRAIAEHDLTCTDDNELNRTRHVDGTFIERSTVAPLNINYHVVHHLWPSIPLYNLPRMHAIVMRNPRVRERAIVWRRYFGKADGFIPTLLV